MKSELNFIVPDVDVNFIVTASPGYMYWKNLDSIYIGCNQNFALVCGLKKPSDIIGKTDFDLPWGLADKNIAKKFVRNDKYVIKTGGIHVSENDSLTVKNVKGIPVVVRSEKSPLVDKNGNLVGILGVAVDITDRLDAEQLRIENATQKSVVEEQEKFRKVVNQVAHDIRSPLASLTMLLKFCDIIPEAQRLALKNATMRISDIANNLLNQFKIQNHTQCLSISTKSPFLVSTELLEIISEKKYEYQDTLVRFTYNFTQEGNFAFSNVEMQSFKRAVSNIINNAVDALKNYKNGVIKLSLESPDEWVRIIIEDNGIGMPPDLVNQIINNIAVTSGKEDGHGLGLSQVREMLRDNNGTLSIKSQQGVGTKIILSLPKIDSPAWLAEKINLNSSDIVVILDDDPSIHGAWEARFIEEAPEVERKHFELGIDTISFIQDLSPEDKKRALLLSDYELLNQNLNGLNVIEKSQIERSILVTSHHNDKQVLNFASKMNTKILPKLLASEVPMQINSINLEEDLKNLRSVDLVVVDDDKLLIDNLKKFVFGKKIVDEYFKAQDFLENYLKYSRSTLMLIDNNFKGETVTGFQILEKLYEAGFYNIYLFSGTDFSSDNSLPKYFKTILKDDIKTIKNLVS